MPVLSEFQPMGAPGQTGRAYMEARNASESWMDRAQARDMRGQDMEAQRQQMALNAILLPVKAAQSKADLVKAKTELDGAIQTQGARESSYALLDSARQDFDFINSVPDANVRARMSREWLSRYSQLANVAELSDEMKTKNHLATSNIMDAMKLSYLGSAESRAFNDLTEGLTPEEKENARRVKLGLKGRAASGGKKSLKVKLPTGAEAEMVFDPGSGEYSIPQIAGGAQSPSEGNTMVGMGTKEEAAAKAEAEAESKLKTERPKRTAAIQQAGKLTEQLSDDIEGLISKVTSATAGPGGVILDKFPGTTARDLQANLDSIKANIGFQALQAMREASPTGGALGQVSDAENKLLQARFGALEIGQSPKQLIENLKKVRQRIQENYGITRSAYESQYGEEVGAEPKSGDVKEVGKYKVRVLP